MYGVAHRLGGLCEIWGSEFSLCTASATAVTPTTPRQLARPGRHWEPLIAPSSYFRVAIDEMLSGKWPDVVLVASRRSPAAFEADLRTIDALRAHKIADAE